MNVREWAQRNGKTIAVAAIGIAIIAYSPVRKATPAKAARNPRMVSLPVLGGASTPPKKHRDIYGNPDPQGVCNFGGPGASANPKVGNMTISTGNDKLGLEKMFNFSLPQGPLTIGGTCPGSTPWCAMACYAAGGMTAFHRGNYITNLKESRRADFPDKIIAFFQAQRTKHKLVRIHVSGDFYSVEYAQKWIKIIKALEPGGWKFYTYTRTWRKPAFREVLADLQSLPNLNIMASTDPTTGPPPAGWREAGVDGGWTGNQILCLSQSKGMTCAQCKFCGPAYKKAKGIFLLIHGVQGRRLAGHRAMLAAALKKGYKLAPGART